MTTNHTKCNQKQPEVSTFCKANVANNVAQAKVRDLTEQWKKNELPDGFYYFKMPDDAIEIASEYRLIRYNLTKDADKIEVIAPVPSYEEWQSLNKALDNTVDANLNQATWMVEMDKEKDKLKELLKDCGRQLEEVELCRYDVADVDQEDWFRISTEQAGIAKKMKTKIDNAIGEKK